MPELLDGVDVDEVVVGRELLVVCGGTDVVTGVSLVVAIS